MVVFDQVYDTWGLGGCGVMKLLDALERVVFMAHLERCAMKKG